MDKINYLSNNQTSQNGKFPVTIQGLEFVQKQISLLQNIAFTGADNYILKPSSANWMGICVINGEVLPLRGVRTVRDTHILIASVKETIRTDSGDYTDVRDVRTAFYGVHSGGAMRGNIVAALPLGNLQTFKTNAYLWERLQELINNPVQKGLPVEVGQFSLKQLNEKKTPARLFCHSSEMVGGNTCYTVDVHSYGSGVIYQELKSIDMRRYGRCFDAHTGNWGTFQPVDEQSRLEAKVIRGTLYLRHGFLPPYARIIMLRKKRRNKNAGEGRPNRSVKCAWYHGWKMEFSQGKPNTWYIPKCINASDKQQASIGKEFAPLMTELLYKPFTQNGHNYWRIAGVNKKWKTIQSAYAKIALAVIHGTAHNVVPQHVLRLKFRVWTQKNTVRKCLSVE